MAQAKRDNNLIETLIGTSNADGSTPVLIKIDPTTHILQTSDDTTGTDLSGGVADRDDNGVPVIMGVSSIDGTTPVAIYTDPSTGELLIDST